jgi:mTERF domain-containing protein
LDDTSLSKLLKTSPTILHYSIEESLEPKLTWLQERLQLDSKILSKLVKKLPGVLGYSIEENLKPKLAWLQERLQLDSKSLSKLVKSMPPVLGCSIEENLEPTLAWLGERLALDDKILSLVIQRMPSLLGCNIADNLEPTIKFYEDCVGSNAARNLILKDPRVLGASLEKRLKPRLAEAQEAGIFIDTGILKRMANYTEDLWSKSLAFQKTKLQDR